MCGNARGVDIVTKYDFGIDYLELIRYPIRAKWS